MATKLTLKETIQQLWAATKTKATEAAAAVVNAAPETLNTLEKLSAALNDDENFATTITNQIASKADKSALETLENAVGGKAESSTVATLAEKVEALENAGGGTSGSSTDNTDSAAVIEKIYPVGSVYLSATEVDPATVLGIGTWEEKAQGKLIVGAGTGTDQNGTSKTFDEGSNAGEYTHLLTASEMPSHTHTTASAGGHSHTITYKKTYKSGKDTKTVVSYSEQNDGTGTFTTTTAGAHTHTITATGGGGYHNVTPPTFGVHIYVRVS